MELHLLPKGGWVAAGEEVVDTTQLMNRRMYFYFISNFINLGEQQIFGGECIFAGEPQSIESSLPHERFSLEGDLGHFVL